LQFAIKIEFICLLVSAHWRFSKRKWYFLAQHRGGARALKTLVYRKLFCFGASRPRWIDASYAAELCLRLRFFIFKYSTARVNL